MGATTDRCKTSQQIVREGPCAAYLTRGSHMRRVFLRGAFCRSLMQGAALMAGALALAACATAGPAAEPATTAAVAVDTPHPTLTATPLPTATDTPAPTSTPTPTPTATLPPTVTPIPLGYPGNPVTANEQWEPYIETIGGVEMALVPAGCFPMGGATDGSTVCFDEPFWIDVYEVTNGQYGSVGCVDFSSGSSQPRTCVNWYDAQTHCAGRGGRLPTAAEWEYAARGPSGWEFPWGDTFDGSRVVYNGSRCEGHGICAVGSRPAGASWVGALDLSGNVWEWAGSDYDASFKSLRGGCMDDVVSYLRPALHNGFDPSLAVGSVGFRCALSWQP